MIDETKLSILEKTGDGDTQDLIAEILDLRRERDDEHDKLIHWMGIASDWSFENQDLKKERDNLLSQLASFNRSLRTALDSREDLLRENAELCRLGDQMADRSNPWQSAKDAWREFRSNK